jgi:hypothetical protein
MLVDLPPRPHPPDNKLGEMVVVSEKHMRDSRISSPDTNAITPKGRRQDSAAGPTKDNATELQRQTPSKQSFEYVWRSGLAGGLAGCAVW